MWNAYAAAIGNRSCVGGTPAKVACAAQNRRLSAALVPDAVRALPQAQAKPPMELEHVFQVRERGVMFSDVVMPRARPGTWRLRHLSARTRRGPLHRSAHALPWGGASGAPVVALDRRTSPDTSEVGADLIEGGTASRSMNQTYTSPIPRWKSARFDRASIWGVAHETGRSQVGHLASVPRPICPVRGRTDGQNLNGCHAWQPAFKMDCANASEESWSTNPVCFRS